MRSCSTVVVAALFCGSVLAQSEAVPAPVEQAARAATQQIATAAIRNAQDLYKQVAPSLVAVQYTWESEMGRREVVGAATVVHESGIVMTTLSLVDPRIPDSQMKDFKILLPNEVGDVEELDATFLGRDERSDVAFVKAKEKRQWTPLRFVDRPLQVGEPLWSVGILPKIAGYKPYIVDGKVAALLRGEMPQVLVSGNLAALGSPVFNSAGEAIGLVSTQTEQPVLLNDPKAGLGSVSRSPVIFVTAGALLDSIADPPAGEPLKLPWIGVMQMMGLTKDVAEYFGLKGQTAVQIGDTIPGGPAERAGIESGQIITALNGKPIPRGDEPEELPMIVRRIMLHMKPGETLKLSLLDPRTSKVREVAVVLEERPRQASLAERFFAEDMGFSVREMVFLDAYSRRLKPGTNGVIVAMVRPQSAAQSARLEPNDMVIELNGQTVTSFEPFVKQYKEFREKRPRDAVVLVVLRDGRNQTIRIEPPQ